MTPHTDFAAVLPGPLGHRGIVVFFEDGTKISHGGYSSVQSAIHGPLGLQRAFDGTASRMLAGEIGRRGLLVMAAIETQDGGAVIMDGTSTWFAPLWRDTIVDLSDLLALKNEASKLVRGSGAVSPPAAKPSTSVGADWVDKVLAADSMAARIARGRVTTEEVRRMLRVLDRHGMRSLSLDSFAAQTGLPRPRIQRYLAQLVEVVNIDGYAALSIVGETIQFNRDLLERQLGSSGQ